MSNTTKASLVGGSGRLTAKSTLRMMKKALAYGLTQFTEIRLFQAELPPSFYDTKYQVMLVAALGQMENGNSGDRQLLCKRSGLLKTADRAEKSTVNCSK